MTSGSSGKPVMVALTEADLDRLAKNEQGSFALAGLTSQDVIQLVLTLDRQFMAGIAYYLGARKAGMTVIRSGPGNVGMQVELMESAQPTVLVAVPSFILQLITWAKDKGLDLNQTSVKKILCIGENIRNEDLSPNQLACKINENWNVQLISTYASTEKQTAFTECHLGQGNHLQSELIYAEILDDDGKPVEPGQVGELTITTLGVEGMPLLRYRTGDLVAYTDEACGCGNSSIRLGPVMGRKNQLIKYNGTTLFPQSVYNVLDGVAGLENYVLRVSKNNLGLDELELVLGWGSTHETTADNLKQALRSALRVVPKLIDADPATVVQLQQQEGKRKLSKILDLR